MLLGNLHEQWATHGLYVGDELHLQVWVWRHWLAACIRVTKTG